MFRTVLKTKFRGVVFAAALLLAGASAITHAQVQREVETFTTESGPIKITPITHASLMIEYGGKVIHVDPWSQGNYEGLPKADVILITDMHPDHLDPAQIDRVRKPDTVVVSPKVVANTLLQAQVIANGEMKTIAGLALEAVAMYNLERGPSSGKLFHDKGRGNGYVLSLGGKRIYLAGDTECTAEMKALKNIDVAFIPMNLPYTMTASEAADCAKVFKPKVAYPYHFRDSDPQEFADALKETEGVEVRVRKWY